jgi:hypothetical protein
MTATNLLDNKPHSVFNYKGVLYIETDSKALPYIILEPTSDIEADIKEGMRYSYYKIGELLYDSFLTNNYEIFVGRTVSSSQQRLF